jgi:hypothetical protein
VTGCILNAADDDAETLKNSWNSRCQSASSGNTLGNITGPSWYNAAAVAAGYS